jgi:hypothetical protein
VPGKGLRKAGQLGHQPASAISIRRPQQIVGGDGEGKSPCDAAMENRFGIAPAALRQHLGASSAHTNHYMCARYRIGDFSAFLCLKMKIRHNELVIH